LKFVKSFDTGTDDFLFMAIKGAAISKNRDIYVVDYRGCYIARYDWNGGFIKKLGQRGQGNGDLGGPIDIRIYDNKIFFNDLPNKRIVETDYKLKKLIYHKIYTGQGFIGDWHMFGPSKCAGYSLSYTVDFEKEYKVMKTLDLETQQPIMFFDKTPIEGLSPKQILKNRMWGVYNRPVFTVDTENKQFIISFMYPNNPVKNYIYSFDGECMDQFSYTFDKRYVRPEHMETGDKRPKEYTANIIYAIMVHKGHFISFIGKVDYKGRDINSKRYCLIVDNNTKMLKHKIPLPDTFRFFSITEDGYLVGTNPYDDEIKIYIYQLTL
jgi:hypothetical protein